ncbi:MAG: S8/S53 family peptidase [Candidatus Thiodiazotropha sp.]
MFKSICSGKTPILGAALSIYAAVVTPIAAAPIYDDAMRCYFADPLYNVPRIWGFMAVFDFDENTTRPAIIDIGILNDGESSNDGIQCDVTFTPTQFVPANFACGQPVNGSYDGVLPNRTTHGTNMKNHIAATINDGGRAGVAGQVAVPNLYRFDEVHNYVFELYSTIDRAVDNEATVINISGSFPCQWKPPFLPGSTFNICTVEGRAAAVTGICLAPVPPTDLVYRDALCAAGVGSIAAEGDIHDLMQNAVTRAKTFGIPIVSSAGNVESGLVGALSGAVVGNADVEDWGIIPPTLDDVIAVGAVIPDPPYSNADFHGNRVDIWAPQNDTSPAAAFISGLIALAQAINPDLNPDSVGIDGDTGELAVDIVTTLRDLLVNTAYPKSVLDSAGHTDPTGLRLNLVDPYGFVLAVSSGLIPDYRTLGYPDHFDSWVPTAFSGSDGPPANCEPTASQMAVNDPPDEQVDAHKIALSTTAAGALTGAILYVPGDPAHSVDEDWLALDHDALSYNGRHVTNLELTYLTGIGDLELSSPDNLLELQSSQDDGVETTKRYRTRQMLGDALVPVVIAGVSEQDDNLYKLSLETDLLITVLPDAFESAGSSNDTLATATIIHGTGNEPNVIVQNQENMLFVNIHNGNFHHIDDLDFFRIAGFDFPLGDSLAGIDYRIEANSTDVDLQVRDEATGQVYAGRGSVEFTQHTSGPFTIEISSRFPGLYVDYDLEILLERESYDFGLKNKMLMEWYKLQDRMIADYGKTPIPELDCLRCNVLNAGDTLDLQPGQLSGVDERLFGAGVSAVRFVTVEQGQPVLISVEKGDLAALKSVALYDIKLNRVAGRISRDSVAFDVAEGVYALVVTEGGRQEAAVLRYGEQVTRRPPSRTSPSGRSPGRHHLPLESRRN